MGIELLKRMIEHYSPSGQESELANFLCEEMASRGFESEIDGTGNAIGHIGAGNKKVYLVGHMDTVPGEIPVRIEEGKLYGRGAVDAKGCLATFIEAASQFKNNKKISLTVIGCVAEEADSDGAKFLLATKKHQPDCVIIGEPSGWDAITLGYKGSVNIYVHLEQEQYHSGHSEPTAAEQAIDLFHRLRAKYGSDSPNFDSAHLKLRAFNTRQNGFQEIAEMRINLRAPLDFDFEELNNFLKSQPENIKAEMGEATPAYKSDKQNPLVRSFLGAIRDQDGKPAFKVKTGTSDMNLLGPAWNVPILAYGPGDSSLDHTPNEHIVISEYERAVTILQTTLERLSH